MTSPEPLQRVLRDFNFAFGTRLSGILTKTGLPVALQSDEKIEEEHFSTMAATIMGATEVIHRGMGLSPPDKILVTGKDSFMLLVNLAREAFFVALGDEGSQLKERTDEATDSLRRVLEPLKPLTRFAR